ncbi:unnamed protein product [Lasius platythorax]|uniref:DUF4219 domain-containing protein n=1 Tax=Lasius platythorax TaxID=488582 RepID=A0AAV2N3W4_9HYME
MSHGAGNSSSTLQLEKLQGRENYSTWKFAMEAYLQNEDLWDCIEAPPGGSISTDQKRVTLARAKIILSLDPLNYVHVQDTKTAAEAWEKLKKAFEDTGLTRRVGLLRTLITTQLTNCASVNDYVNTVITTAHELAGIGFKIGDEWIGTLLLLGLPEEYKPMIMGLENSGTPITGDTIKIKLLQDVKWEKNVHNKGRLFYKCAKPQGSVDNRGNTDWNNFTVNRGGNRTHSRVIQKGSALKKPKLEGSKRKCGKCKMEGHTRTRCPEYEGIFFNTVL